MALVKYNNNSISAITTAGTLATGAMVLIKSQTASSSSTISFVDGTSDVVLDNTYPIYLFHFINLHPSAGGKVSFNLSVDSGSNYNVAKTSTVFFTQHGESGTGGELNQSTARDLAQGTGIQHLTNEAGNDNDQGVSGYLHLFDPSSTTFVKHYIAVTNSNFKYSEPYAYNHYIAGYGNTTSAVDAVQFAMGSGNIDSGTIKLYGLKDS